MKYYNWLFYNIPENWEVKAKRIRVDRDKLYGNIFSEEDTDLRWVGDLGEICFNYWLKKNGILNFEWHLDNVAGKPDFTVNNIRIDVKTVKRKGPPKSYYTAQITARHKDHPIDELFFLSYEYKTKKLWLLGGITMLRFLENSKYYAEGEQVHDNYIIRKDHEIYNAKISILDTPENWINEKKLSL